MLIGTRLTVGVLLVLCPGETALLQVVNDAPAQPIVTVAPTEQGLRFAALGDVVEMRLELFSVAGEKLFDSEFRRGNVLDWSGQDFAGSLP